MRELMTVAAIFLGAVAIIWFAGQDMERQQQQRDRDYAVYQQCVAASKVSGIWAGCQY
jgi:hypothetical protein